MSEELEFTVVSRGSTPEDTAAVTAVLRAALEEHALELEAQHSPVPSAWLRGRRPLRSPIAPGPGRWRGFSG